MIDRTSDTCPRVAGLSTVFRKLISNEITAAKSVRWKGAKESLSSCKVLRTILFDRLTVNFAEAKSHYERTILATDDC